MIAPVTWGRSGYDGRCHAFPTTAEDRPFVEALCTHTLPTELLSPMPGPAGALCMPCVTVVASELPEPRDPML